MTVNNETNNIITPIVEEKAQTSSRCSCIRNIVHKAIQIFTPQDLAEGTSKICSGFTSLKLSGYTGLLAAASLTVALTLAVIAAISSIALGILGAPAALVTLGVGVPLFLAKAGFIVGTVSFIASTVLGCIGLVNVYRGGGDIYRTITGIWSRALQLTA